jgi:hypothetical protein
VKSRTENNLFAPSARKQWCDEFQTFHVWLPSVCRFAAENEYLRKKAYSFAAYKMR